jgi:hypothetical protein
MLFSRLVEINCRKSAELKDQLLISARARLKSICMPTLEVDNGIFSQAVLGSHWHAAASLCVLQWRKGSLKVALFQTLKIGAQLCQDICLYW